MKVLDLIKVDFFLPQIAQFGKSINLFLLVIQTFEISFAPLFFFTTNSQQKRYLQVLGTKVSLLGILFEFFISGNYEFFQIALLQVCARTSQHNFV